MNPSQCRAYLGHLERFGIKLGLDTISLLLEGLGCPHRQFPSILVAGTNGKGSVSTIVARILRENGFRVGLYTSPHLVSVEERVMVGGRRIAPRRFCALLARIKEAADDLIRSGRLASPPTFFEVLTALAFLEFAERKVDIAVLEVGMGGRFDATNVVSPVLSVITTVSRDHQRHLGRTLRSIAFEKAGIIKPGIPVVSGVRNRLARIELRKRAKERGATFLEVFGPGTEFEVSRRGAAYRFRYKGHHGEYRFSPALAGSHQGRNAAVAVAASEALGRFWHPLDPAKVIRGVESSEWEGRLETVSRAPWVILDGAHNVEGAESLAIFIREVIRRPPVLVFGVMKDKEIGAMCRLLFSLSARVILTAPPNKRAASPEDVLRAARTFGEKIEVIPDIRSAVAQALHESRGRVPVVIAGSLFLIGEVKRLRLFPRRK